MRVLGCLSDVWYLDTSTFDKPLSTLTHATLVMKFTATNAEHGIPRLGHAVTSHQLLRRLFSKCREDHSNKEVRNRQSDVPSDEKVPS